MNNDLSILSDCLEFAKNTFGSIYLENSDYDTIGKKENLANKIKAKTPKIISLYKSAKKEFINNSNISESTIEFVQLISMIKQGNIEQDFFNEIVSELKSPLPKDYYGIKCELSVYQQHKASGIKIIKIPKNTTETPDFKIEIDDKFIYVECKSIISESVKLTPRLSALIQKLMNLVKNNLAVNIVLKSKKPNIYEPEVEKLVRNAVKINQEKLYDGDYCSVQLIKPITKNGNDELVIPNFNPSQNIGDFIVKIIDGKMIGRCVNFFPFFPNDYKNELANHLKKGNSQIRKLGKGILHIQLPSMNVNELQMLISQHGHRIQDFINKNSLLAVVLNIPYLIQKNNVKNELVNNINLSYFKPNSVLQKLVDKKPYWLKNYKLIETIEKGNVIYFEFETYTPLNSFVLNIRNSKLGLNIKVFIIGNQILYESITEESCKVRIIKIPLNLIKESNKLALTVGDVESIYINGQKLGTTPYKINC
jgi:hypothetical protein